MNLNNATLHEEIKDLNENTIIDALFETETNSTDEITFVKMNEISIELGRPTKQDNIQTISDSVVKVPDTSPQAIEKALRQLKRQLKDSELFQEMRDRRYFKKPSLARREQMQAAKRLNEKRVREEKLRDKRHTCWTIMTKDGAK